MFLCFLYQKGDERQRRASKEQLVDKGILKPEPVFGNSLVICHT